MKDLKNIYPERIYFIITGNATLQNAIIALRNGADDYFIKPLIIDNVIRKAQEAIEKQRLLQELEAEQRLKESEKNYRLAFNRANFYKDLVIHDINNILNIVVSNVQLHKLYQKHPEKSKDPDILIERIREASSRGIKLVSNIQKLSELEEVEVPKKAVDVSKVLKSAVNYIKRTLDLKKLIDSQNQTGMVVP